jgi:hypothetical protein
MGAGKLALHGTGRIRRSLAVDDELKVRQTDLDRLLDWMRRSGRPRTTAELVRFWIERLREEAGGNRGR